MIFPFQQYFRNHGFMCTHVAYSKIFKMQASYFLFFRASSHLIKPWVVGSHLLGISLFWLISSLVLFFLLAQIGKSISQDVVKEGNWESFKYIVCKHYRNKNIYEDQLDSFQLGEAGGGLVGQESTNTPFILSHKTSAHTHLTSVDSNVTKGSRRGTRRADSCSTMFHIGQMLVI